MPQDLDQGGSIREWFNTYLGPSLGWTRSQFNNIYPVTAATDTIPQGTTLVTVSRNGTVALTLPLSKTNPTPAINFISLPLTVVDIGGFASDTNTITLTCAGSDTISGLTSIQITTSYGGFTLKPISGGWTLG